MPASAMETAESRNSKMMALPSNRSASTMKKQPVPAIYRGGLLLYFLLKLLEQR